MNRLPKSTSTSSFPSQSPSTTTSSPPPPQRTTSPLALPALHLGSFSDLKLAEQFGIGIGNAGAVMRGFDHEDEEDEEEDGGGGDGGMFVTANSTPAPPSHANSPTFPTQEPTQEQHDRFHRQCETVGPSPASIASRSSGFVPGHGPGYGTSSQGPGYAAPGIPVLRESTINRRRTIVVNDSQSSSSASYDYVPRQQQQQQQQQQQDSGYSNSPLYRGIDDLPDRVKQRQREVREVKEVKDHPDYAGFPYTPARAYTHTAIAAAAATATPVQMENKYTAAGFLDQRTASANGNATGNASGMKTSRSLGALASFTPSDGNTNGNDEIIPDAEEEEQREAREAHEVDSGVGIEVDDDDDDDVLGRKEAGGNTDRFYSSQRRARPTNPASRVQPAQYQQQQQHQSRAHTLPQQYSSTPSSNDFGLLIVKKQQHQQSRSMGTIGTRDPRARGEGSPVLGNVTTMTGRPRTVFDVPSFPRHVSEPLAGPAQRVPNTTMTTQYQQPTYDPSTDPANVAVPTIPGLLASVRGGAQGQGSPYPLAARPRAVSEWTREEQQDREGQAGDVDGRGSGGKPVERNPDPAMGKVEKDDGIVPLRVKIPPPQEEICMECLMRDRDLIHVKVIGDAVWSRASDADFKELLERERTVDEASDKGEASRRVVRWRGFSWEEHGEGERLPETFRGRFEGELRETKLKELATKMIAPSAHRYKTLQKYLADQARLFGIPPEEEQQLESSVWLREHERIGSASRSSSAARGNGQDAGYAQSSGHRQPGYEQRGTTSPLHWPDRSLSANARATMYDGVPPQSQYTSQSGRGQPSEYDNVARANPRLPAIQLDVRKGRGISSPGLLELSSQPPRRVISRPSPTVGSFRQDQMYNFNDDEESMILDLTDQEQTGAGSAPLRPFSFAVRAGRSSGNAGSTRSSPGPGEGREGLSGVLGRWGGSVTSLFGGSQAGGSHWGGSHGGNSGSMMDMHLGLDLDRRRPNAANAHPRATSMASLSRPRFFSRATSSYMSHQGPGDTGSMLTAVDTRVSEMPYERSQAGSRQAAAPARPAVQEEKKKKGFKGLLQKIGGKKNKSAGTRTPVSRSGSTGPPSRDEDYSTPLAPPPPISFLVQRSDRAANHTRTSSSSSLSAFSGSGSPPQGSPVSMMMRLPGANDAQLQPPTNYHTQRSVSAPLVQSPSRGSLADVTAGSGNPRMSYHRDPPSAPSQYGSNYNTVNGSNRDSYISASSRGRNSIPGLHVRNDSQGMEYLENDGSNFASGPARATSAYVTQTHDQLNDRSQPHPSKSHQGYRGPPSLSSSTGTLLQLSLESPGLGNSSFSNVRVASSGPGTPAGERSSLQWQSPVMANQTFGLVTSETGGDNQKSLPALPHHGPGNSGGGNGLSGRQDNRFHTDSPDSLNGFHNQENGSIRHAYPPGKQQHVRQHSTLSSVSGRPPIDATSTGIDKSTTKTKTKFTLKNLFSTGINGKDTSANKRDTSTYFERLQHDSGVLQQPAFPPPGPLRYAPESLGRTQSAGAQATSPAYPPSRYGQVTEYGSPNGYSHAYDYERKGMVDGSYGQRENTYPPAFAKPPMHGPVPPGSRQPRQQYDPRARQTFYQ